MTWSNYVQDEQWEHFIEVLWDYQWTNVPTKLTSEFIEVFIMSHRASLILL